MAQKIKNLMVFKKNDIGFIEDDFTENDKKDDNNNLDINSSEDSE